MKPFFKTVERDCQKVLLNEEYIFYDQKYNTDIENNNYQVFPQDFSTITPEEYSLKDSHWDAVQNYVLTNTKFYKKKEDFTADFWVDYTDRNNPPKFEIDIQEKIFQSKGSIAPNYKDTAKAQGKMSIMLVYIDTISRAQFFRSWPKTADYLEKYYDPTQNWDLPSIGFQSFRAQSFTGFTWENVIDLRYGHCKTTRWSGLSKPGGIPHMTHVANDQGYITAYTSDMCNFYEQFGWASPFIDRTMADHIQLGVACNPNSWPTNDAFDLFIGPFSMTRRCYLGDDQGKYLLEYAFDFHKKYKGKPKFSYNVFIDGHELSTFVPGYLDKHFVKFIKQLEEEKILEDTMVVFLSDHGQHSTPGNLYQQGSIEHYNWFLHILYPRQFLTQDVEKFMKENTQKLLTHADLRKVIVQHMLGTEERKATREEIRKYNFKYAYNFFHESIPDSRTCENIVSDDDIGKDKLCICEEIPV